MKLTKLEHSGMILEKDGKRIVFDPVEFATVLPSIQNVVAIIITHTHSDHLQLEKISQILDLNPEAKVIAPVDAKDMLPEVVLVSSNDELEIAGFTLKFFGQDHAIVLDGKVPCNNIGVVIDDIVVNPGDSFDLPNEKSQNSILLVPEVAPWTKVSETVGFINNAKPHMVIPVHDAPLSVMGKAIYDNLLRNACEKNGIEFAPLAVGETIDI